MELRGRDIFQHESEEDKRIAIFELPVPKMGVKYTVGREHVAIQMFTIEKIREYADRQEAKGLYSDLNVALYVMQYLQTWWFWSKSKEYLISWLWIRMNELDWDFDIVLQAITLDHLISKWPVELEESARKLWD